MYHAGKDRRVFQHNMFKLNESRREVERSYQENVAQLKFSKDEAVRKSTNEFNQLMLSIGQDRSLIETAKAERKLEALTSYRDAIVKAQQTEQEFQDRLSYQREVAEMELQRARPREQRQERREQQRQLPPGGTAIVGGGQFVHSGWPMSFPLSPSGRPTGHGWG